MQDVSEAGGDCRKRYQEKYQEGKDSRISGVEPEMQMIGAMIVSWIIQCSEAESGGQVVTNPV